MPKNDEYDDLLDAVWGDSPCVDINIIPTPPVGTKITVKNNTDNPLFISDKMQDTLYLGLTYPVEITKKQTWLYKFKAFLHKIGRGFA